jgi:hypothetical protein
LKPNTILPQNSIIRNDFKSFAAAHCSTIEMLTELPYFPTAANYRDLKYFVNIYNIGYKCSICLEELHDRYLEGSGIN